MRVLYLVSCIQPTETKLCMQMLYLVYGRFVLSETGTRYRSKRVRANGAGRSNTDTDGGRRLRLRDWHKRRLHFVAAHTARRENVEKKEPP